MPTTPPSKTSKALPRLSVVMEESTLYESAASVAALLPCTASTSRSTYFAVANHPHQHTSSSPATPPPLNHGSTGSTKALDMSALLSMYGATSGKDAALDQKRLTPNTTPAVNVSAVLRPPVLQLCLYSLQLEAATPPTPLSSIAPDMMLIQTVDVTCDDLRLALPPQKTNSSNTKESVVDENSTSSKRVPTTMSPEAVVVEELAWVGVGLLALKTRQRQLILVQTGLTGQRGAASSEDDSDEEVYEQATGLLRKSPVCRVFNRVADFSAVTLSKINEQLPSGEAVVFVACMQRVSAVVARTSAARTATDASPSVQEHSWSIGSFNHLSAVASNAGHSTSIDGPTLYFCGTSASNSVEVFHWTFNSATPPVCVHHVLMTPGHFFYGVSVSLTSAAAPHRTGVNFWVVGASVTAVREASKAVVGHRFVSTSRSCRQSSEENLESVSPELPALPALRGLDGNFFQVELPHPASCPSSQARDTAAPLPSTEHRTLNSVWHGSSAHRKKKSVMQTEVHDTTNSGVDGGGAATHTPTAVESLLQLESLSSLRIRTPPFLPSHNRNAGSRGTTTSTNTSSPPTPPLHRFLLHVHATDNVSLSEDPASTNGTVMEENAKHGWASAMLSLDTAECASALAWLTGSGTSEELPFTPWRLNSVVLQTEDAANVDRGSEAVGVKPLVQHQLTLHTSHRVLRLCVNAPFSQPTSQSGEPLLRGVHVAGTHELSASDCAVGVCVAPIHNSNSPMLLLYGTGKRIEDESSTDEQKLTVYGQAKAATTWTVVANMSAAWLRTLKPWKADTTATGDKSELGTKEKEALLAEVQSLVEAEGQRLQRHFDARMDRLEALLGKLGSK